MEAMATGLVIGVLVLAGLVVARLAWRRVTDERQSVQEHQHTLDTLRHMADSREQSLRSIGGRGARRRPGPGTAALRPRRQDGAPRPATRAPAGPGRSPGRADAPGSGRGAAGADHRHGTDGARSHRSGPAATSAPVGTGGDDATLLGRFPRRPPTPPAPRSGTSAKAVTAERPATAVVDGAATGAPGSAAAGPARAPASVVGSLDRARLTRLAVPVAVLVVVGAAALSLELVRSPSPRPRGDSHPPARHLAGAGSTTTVPADAALTPSNATASSATYAAPAGAFTVAVDAAGLCWVDATDATSGAVVWTGTMTAGQHRPLPGTGPMDLRLGAASDVSVTLDGRPVRLPAGFHSPFTMSFVPARA